MSANASFMEAAFRQAQLASERGEVPVGAVIVSDNKIIAQAGNRIVELRDPTGHAEMIAIRSAAEQIGNERLTGCDLYVTLEPCTMCAAAISFARIRRLYYGAEDIKAGAVDNGVRYFNQGSCNHVPEVYAGIMESQCAGILKDFFRKKR